MTCPVHRALSIKRREFTHAAIASPAERENAPQAARQAHRLISGVPVQPGIGTGEGALGELHPLLLGVEAQQDTQALADIALDDKSK